MCRPQYSRGTGPLAPVKVAGWPCPPAEPTASARATRTIRTRARLPRTGVLDGGTEAGDHRLRRPFADGVQGVVAQATAHGIVTDDRIQSRTESGSIALGNDEPVDAVLDQPTRGRPDRVGGDHGDTLVERLVDDEAPE